MRRADSTLFAPYRSMGVVCSDVRPVVRPNESKTRCELQLLFEVFSENERTHNLHDRYTYVYIYFLLFVFRMTSLICPVDNVVMHYKAEKLRLVGVSDVLPDIVTAIAADRRWGSFVRASFFLIPILCSSGVYAAAGTSIAVMKTCRHISRLIDVGAKTKFMKVLGDNLVSFWCCRMHFFFEILSLSSLFFTKIARAKSTVTCIAVKC